MVVKLVSDPCVCVYKTDNEKRKLEWMKNHIKIVYIISTTYRYRILYFLVQYPECHRPTIEERLINCITVILIMEFVQELIN